MLVINKSIDAVTDRVFNFIFKVYFLYQSFIFQNSILQRFNSIKYWPVMLLKLCISGCIGSIIIIAIGQHKMNAL